MLQLKWALPLSLALMSGCSSEPETRSDVRAASAGGQAAAQASANAAGGMTQVGGVAPAGVVGGRAGVGGSASSAGAGASSGSSSVGDTGSDASTAISETSQTASGAATSGAPGDTPGDTMADGSSAAASQSSATATSERGSDDSGSSDGSNDEASGEGTDDDGTQAPEGDGDLAPPRPLAVTAPARRHEHRFRASAADPEVSYNDNDQIAVFDNRAPVLMGKLVLTFGGAGETKGNLTGGGEFCARRGFHVLAVAAFQAYNIVIHGPDFYGQARRSVFEGIMHTREDAFANIELTLADGVARRTQKALQYLHAMYPEQDWGYYLQEDGSVRWSDVIFTGVSHGASNSARFASLVRASRVVSIAGPRDNMCERVDISDCGGEVATWLNETPQTPIDRFYAITGVQDDQHTQHLFAMEKLGYVGEPTPIDGAQAPYGGSHRLVSSAGHDDFCGQQAYRDACNYVFGVPPENHTGTGP